MSEPLYHHTLTLTCGCVVPLGVGPLNGGPDVLVGAGSGARACPTHHGRRLVASYRRTLIDDPTGGGMKPADKLRELPFPAQSIADDLLLTEAAALLDACEAWLRVELEDAPKHRDGHEDDGLTLLARLEGRTDA